MHPASISLLALSLLPLCSSLDIYHRVLSPSSPPPDWTLRAQVELSPATGHGSYLPVDSAGIAQLLGGVRDPGALYQVALGREGGQGAWSSVRACYAAAATSDLITLRASSADAEPYTLSYTVDPVPSSGACPQLSRAPDTLFRNTSIVFRTPDSVPPLALKTPPKLSAEGEVVKPEPEKSFIQKYWMYALPLVIILLMSPGGDGGGEGGGGGGGAAR